MAGPLQRLTPGQALRQLSAGSWNRAMAATLTVEQLGGNPTAGKFASPPEARFIKLTNGTGADRNAKEIVGYDGHALNWPDDNDTLPERSIPVAVAAAPTSDERFGVLVTSAQDGEPAVAQITGFAYVLVDVKDASDVVCGPVDDQYTHLDSGTGTTPILAKALAGEETETGVQWCLVELGAQPAMRITRQYAVVTSSTGAASFAGSADSNDFTVCEGAGTCVLLRELTQQEVDDFESADDWQATTSYDADEPWTGTVDLGLVDPVDINDVPLVLGRTYEFSYPTGQTSGSTLDEAELAKAVVGRWVPDDDDVGCLTMPVLADDETMSDYHLILRCVHDETGLHKNRVVAISNAEGTVIPPGPYEGAPIVYGEYVRVTDYLRGLNNFDVEKILWTPDGDAIEWAGDECEA